MTFVDLLAPPARFELATNGLGNRDTIEAVAGG